MWGVETAEADKHYITEQCKASLNYILVSENIISKLYQIKDIKLVISDHTTLILEVP